MSLRTMDWIEEQLRRAPAPNAIIHMGAGLCRELPHYIKSGAERIVLIEPNPEVLPDLQKQAAAHPNIQILPVAIAAEPGRRALKLYNDPDLSSLRRPTGLIELLPGLKQTGQAIVNVIAAHTLPEQLGLKNDENNWLVIDTPGEEAAIVSNLEQHKQLSQFDRIIIRAGAASLYEGTPACEQLILQLENLGYYIEGAEDTSDRDWPRYQLRLNPKAIEVRRLRRENEALIEQKSQLEKRTEQLDEVKQQAEQHEQKLTRQNEELRVRIEELEKFCRQAEQLAEKHKAKSSELNSRVEELNAEKATLDKQNKEFAEQLERIQQQAEQQKKVFTSQNENLRANLEELKNSRQQAEKQAEKHKAQLEKAQADLSLALRLQMLRENDLKELQARYGELLTIKDEQQDLLTQLHHRLSRAAEYLQLVHAQSDEQLLPKELLEALTGKGDQPD